MQKLPAIVVAVGVLASLSGCAGSPFASGCTPTYSEGSNASLVTASGGFSSDPKADFPTPLIAKKPQVHVIDKGDGAVVDAGDAAEVQLTLYNGKTGERIVSTKYDQPGFVFTAVEAKPAFGTMTQCVPVGSRVAAVGTARDLLGPASIAQNRLSLALDDTVVIVVDVEQSFLGKANGADQVAPSGLPAVVLAPNGQPGLTFPNTDPPSDLTIAVLKRGDGEKVAKNDNVVLNYSGFAWETKSVFISSWEVGSPQVLSAVSLDDAPAGLPPGLAKALIGQKVGSQVIVVIPPKFGYPAGKGPSGLPPGSTMVFVFDILGIE